MAYHSQSTRFSTRADFDAIMPNIVNDLKRHCRVSAPCLRQVLLPSEDDRVHHELMRRMEGAGSALHLGSQSWPRAYTTFLNTKGIRQSTLRASAETVESPWFSTLCHRERQVLAYEQRDAGEEVLLLCTGQLDRRTPPI